MILKGYKPSGEAWATPKELIELKSVMITLDSAREMTEANISMIIGARAHLVILIRDNFLVLFNNLSRYISNSKVDFTRARTLEIDIILSSISVLFKRAREGWTKARVIVYAELEV